MPSTIGNGDGKKALVRRKFKADDPMVKILIRKYSDTEQIKGVQTSYKMVGDKREIDTIELLIEEQKMDRDDSIAHIRINRNLFEGMSILLYFAYPHPHPHTFVSQLQGPETIANSWFRRFWQYCIPL